MTNFASDYQLAKLTDKRSDYDHKFFNFLKLCAGDTNYILPFDFIPDQPVNIFAWYRQRLPSDELIASVLDYEPYFETGLTKLKVHVEGRRYGYNGSQIAFNRITKVKADRDYVCILAPKDLHFYVGDSSIPDLDPENIGTTEEYHYGHFDTELIWIAFNNPDK